MEYKAKAVICRELNKPVVVETLTVEGPKRGEVTVKSATWNRRVTTPTIYDLAAKRTAAIESGGPVLEPAATTVPLRFDVHISVPSTLRIDNNLARIVANADLSLRGTYDRPVMLGHADVERGDVTRAFPDRCQRGLAVQPRQP